MDYTYSGRLRALLAEPDPAAVDVTDAVTFTASDLEHWRFKDLFSEREWRHCPMRLKASDEGLRIEGRFNDVRQIDNLTPDDPSFWVPLSSIDGGDPRFPVDLSRYPILEIRYRCTSANARPAWFVTYPGGTWFDWLPPTQDWRTVACSLQHFGFPTSVTNMVLRLYSVSRTTESMDVAWVRFRAATEKEGVACRTGEAVLDEQGPPPKYPILDEFMPFGCYMDAGSSKRLAAMLGISLTEYWTLVLEDIARHHHNTIALEGIDRLTQEEWGDLLKMATQYEVRFFAIHNIPLDSPFAYRREFVQTHIQPHIDSPAIFAWAIHDEPPEDGFQFMLEARSLVEDADPNHPLAVVSRNPNGHVLYGRHFAAAGIANYTSHEPWQAGEIVRAHLPNARGQQLWFVAPGFVYATDTPEWHSCPEMRLTINLALANGARGWFTFAYHNDPIWIRGSCQRSLTGPFLTFSDLWQELGQRVENFHSLSPLFLAARAGAPPEDWFVLRSVAHTNSQLPEGIGPTGLFRLAGDDFDLYSIVSNDIREMTTVNVDTSSPARSGLVAYDLADYTRTRRWEPMPDRRHLEMFPGQKHVILVAKPAVAEHWRATIAQRLIHSDRRALAFDLALARAYNLDTSDIEWRLSGIGDGGDPKALESIRHARDILLDIVYDAPSLYESNSEIVSISAAICACDGSLCRLLSQGKSEQARQMGFKVIPLAREMSHLRLELHMGKGREILEHCKALSRRTLETLHEIRGLF